MNNKQEHLSVSLSKVLPEIGTLSRMEKIRLIQLLAKDLERDETNLIEPGRTYSMWSPDRAFAAADSLLQALQNDKVQQ